MSAERTVRFCRVCNDANPVPVVKRDRLPAMQNYVYRTAEDAKNSALGDFNLVFCRSCSFVYNATFETSLLHYDAEYDNSVPSQVMAEYYERIATYLLTQYSIDDGLVIDVGCGNGTFLGALAKISTRVRGLGIDPSYDGETESEDGRIQFVRDQLLELKADGWSLAIWGMAAKGVMFSFMIDADRSLIDHCVDVNANKHGCFVPVTAHPIEPPAVLRKLGGSPLMVVVMNSNYLAEIRVSCREMGLSPTFMDAAGQSL